MGAVGNRVRTLASYIWNTSATAEVLHGVQFDAVLRLEADRWVLIEITQSNTIDKLRIDLAKFAPVRQALLSESVHVTCYFVTPTEPSPRLVETAESLRVIAVSVAQLEKKFFDYEKYHFIRSSKPFGSAIDLVSGKKDELPYVPVNYNEVGKSRTYSLQELADALCNHRKIILLGNYGTGKSRCIQELFDVLGKLAEQRRSYPVAIDLREHWGLRRRTEIIRRHFDDLGISDGADSTLRVIDTGAVTLLLDGFDEIASQAWSDDPTRLEEIRAKSLVGVADLITANRGGVLVVGREHYFNSDTEMFHCLGMDPGSTLIVSCAEEFSDEQMDTFLRAVRTDLTIPSWLPKRPLVSKMLAGFDNDALETLSEDRAETDFWKIFLDTICQRESRIHQSLDPFTIRSILLQLANLSRTKIANVGPVSLEELNATFESVVGSPPRDEAAVMLQRLPVLGRTDASSSDRHFLDTYILDGLRATSVVEMSLSVPTGSAVHERWLHHLGPFGQSILTQAVADSRNSAAYIPFIRQLSASNNRVLAGDLLTALLGIDETVHSFRGLVLSDSHLGIVNLAEAVATDLRIVNCFIDELTVGSNEPDSISVENCLIGTLRGLSSDDRAPSWIVNSTIDKFDALTNVSKIRQAKLTRAQSIFVTIVHKTFFQPGSGRKEEALLRGLGSLRDRKTAQRVLSMLIEEGILNTFPGNEGTVYVPARKHTRRMAQIIGQLRYSSDPLWRRLRSKNK